MLFLMNEKDITKIIKTNYVIYANQTYFEKKKYKLC